MPVFEDITEKLKSEKLHFSLLDPDKAKTDLDKLGSLSKELEKKGTNAIMVGGSTSVDREYLDEVIRTIKENTSLPVILFPGGLSGVSRYADAIFFMSLVNSKDPFWIVGAQAKAAPIVRDLGVEPISMGYIIVEPGMRVGEVGKAEVVKQFEPEKAVEYAMAAQYMGMQLVYLEAGSGATSFVPPEMVKMVKDALDIPLIVGGGIRTPEAAKKIAEAGADIIVTGTLIEKGGDVEPLIRAIKG